jgi:hypothetical protein
VIEKERVGETCLQKNAQECASKGLSWRAVLARRNGEGEVRLKGYPGRRSKLLETGELWWDTLQISYWVKDVSGKVHAEGWIVAMRFDLDRWIKTLPQPWSAAMEARRIR